MDDIPPPRLLSSGRALFLWSGGAQGRGTSTILFRHEFRWRCAVECLNGGFRRARPRSDGPVRLDCAHSTWRPSRSKARYTSLLTDWSISISATGAPFTSIIAT
jgi:hypothetical protein